MQNLLFYSFRRDIRHFFGVFLAPFVLHCHAVLLFGRVGFSFGDMRAVAETHAKASFLQFQKGCSALCRCCVAPVLSFLLPSCFAVRENIYTAMLFCCSGRQRFFPMATKVRSSSANSCKSFFSTVSEGTFGTFFWCCLAPLLSFTAILFCCSGGYTFFP